MVLYLRRLSFCEEFNLSNTVTKISSSDINRLRITGFGVTEVPFSAPVVFAMMTVAPGFHGNGVLDRDGPQFSVCINIGMDKHFPALSSIYDCTHGQVPFSKVRYYCNVYPSLRGGNPSVPERIHGLWI